MLKKIFLPIAILASISCIWSCNSKSEDDNYGLEYSASTEVTDFYIKNDQKVLDSLSNVYFSIDLIGARIYNADSLPFGTDVSHLVPSISTAGASAVKIEIPRLNMTDSVVDYMKNSTDSIDFSNGPVKLRITSQNGAVERLYEVRVNVHKTKPDSLVWSRIEATTLPSDFGTPAAQVAAKLGDSYYCLTSSADGKYCMATTTDPAADWTTAAPAFSFTPQVETMRSSDTALYILAADGAMYTSTDGMSWTATGATFTHIYGGYTDQVLCCKRDGDACTAVLYPSGKEIRTPDGFPVEGTSLPAVYTSEMSYCPQLTMIGGKTATGEFVDASFGFDGENLVKISQPYASLPEGLSGVSLVAYDLFKVPTSSWKPVEYPALIAMGGINDKGEINRQVYYSLDWGMTWRAASELMRIPEEVGSFYGAVSLVHSTTMHVAARSAAWREIPMRALPNPAWRYVDEPRSRVSALPIEWQCPAIYTFGGRDADGNTRNQLWRALITRFTFQPKV